MPMPDGANLVFPAVGPTQVCCGRIDNIWYTWIQHGEVHGKRHSHTDRKQAIEVYDHMIDVHKATHQESRNDS